MNPIIYIWTWRLILYKFKNELINITHFQTVKNTVYCSRSQKTCFISHQLRQKLSSCLTSLVYGLKQQSLEINSLSFLSCNLSRLHRLNLTLDGLTINRTITQDFNNASQLIFQVGIRYTEVVIMEESLFRPTLNEEKPVFLTQNTNYRLFGLLS